jgi:galactose-1-phosphate uridylyltransferase
MFSVTELKTGEGTLQYRRDWLTGLSCRISSERIKRGIDQAAPVVSSPPGCPFCPDQVRSATPVFPGGERITVGESVTFPNLFPFAAWHTVTVISRDHTVGEFSRDQLGDAFRGSIRSLQGQKGYPSINWNYLPSAGASLAHPHLQGLVDPRPSLLADRYHAGCELYYRGWGSLYWDDLRSRERDGPRYLFGEEILWLAHAVPLGEREVRALLPIRTLGELEPFLDTFVEGLRKVIGFSRSLGTSAFNLSLFFDREGEDRGFRAFCSIIARINPNPASLSDSSFMERLHLEPLILTAPEEVARMFRKRRQRSP